MDRRASIAAVLMFATSLAVSLRSPSRKLVERLPALHLEEAAPGTIGDWSPDSRAVPLPQSPDVEEQVRAIYSQTVSRNYQHADGTRIMLLIAYGEDQADATTQLHQPELCYATQGFDVTRMGNDTLALSGARLPVVRLHARRRNRSEPITYWTTVADEALNTEASRRLARARFSLRGEIPDGMLVRVSSIETDSSQAFHAHDRFIADWSSVVTRELHPRIFGSGN